MICCSLETFPCLSTFFSSKMSRSFHFVLRLSSHYSCPEPVLILPWRIPHNLRSLSNGRFWPRVVALNSVVSALLETLLGPLEDLRFLPVFILSFVCKLVSILRSIFQFRVIFDYVTSFSSTFLFSKESRCF